MPGGSSPACASIPPCAKRMDRAAPAAPAARRLRGAAGLRAPPGLRPGGAAREAGACSCCGGGTREAGGGIGTTTSGCSAGGAGPAQASNASRTRAANGLPAASAARACSRSKSATNALKMSLRLRTAGEAPACGAAQRQKSVAGNGKARLVSALRRTREPQTQPEPHARHLLRPSRAQRHAQGVLRRNAPRRARACVREGRAMCTGASSSAASARNASAARWKPSPAR